MFRTNLHRKNVNNQSDGDEDVVNWVTERWEYEKFPSQWIIIIHIFVWVTSGRFSNYSFCGNEWWKTRKKNSFIFRNLMRKKDEIIRNPLSFSTKYSEGLRIWFYEENCEKFEIFLNIVDWVISPHFKYFPHLTWMRFISFITFDYQPSWSSGAGWNVEQHKTQSVTTCTI